MKTKSILDYFPKHLTPRDVQRGALLELEKQWNRADIFVLNLPVACHKVGQQVLMHDGTLGAIEDIKVGDKLMGPDSNSRAVLEVHKGAAPLFKIIPKRGPSWTVTENHILRLWRYIRTSIEGKRVGSFAYEEITVKEYITKSKDYKNNSWMQRVGVDFPEKELPLDPYLLGAWLGDGNSDSPAITTMDNEIRDAWITLAEQHGHDVRKETKPDNKASTYYITTGRTGGKTKNKVLNLLRELTVYKNKHIPNSYLTGSRKQRLELLAGIIDTDGHTAPGKASIEITQVRKQLADDILYLCRSLGFSANQHVKVIDDVEYYRCHISGQHVEDIPVRLKYKTPLNSKSNQANYKFDIEQVEEGDFAGVTVDSDNLYLLDDFTVSHNSGKSAIAHCISKWQKSASIITPTKLLVQQYKDEYKSLQVLKGKADHYCSTYQCTMDKRPIKKGETKTCPAAWGCKGCQQYIWDLRRSFSSKIMLCNYFVYFAHKVYRDTLIADEAHNIVDMVKTLNTRRFWVDEISIDHPLSTRKELSNFIGWQSEPRVNASDKLTFIRDELTAKYPSYLINFTERKYHDRVRECIEFVPLDIRDCAPILWPGQVKKIVLMSATLSRKDIEQLGLGGKRIQYISADSPIATKRRPVTVPVERQNMSYRYQAENIPKLAAYIEKVAKFKSEDKGLVHATYAMAKVLKEHLGHDDRYIFHNKTDKAEKYNYFRETDEPKILIASGMYEGISLDYDAGRWQIISKVPWPSLADPAIKYLAERDSEFYSWQAIKDLLQASGRISRKLDDYGATFIFDSSFLRLYKENPDLFPNYWRNSLRIL